MPHMGKAKPRAHTRGPGHTGMSAGNIMEGQITDQFPREPSHYLGAAPQQMMGMSEG